MAFPDFGGTASKLAGGAKNQLVSKAQQAASKLQGTAVEALRKRGDNKSLKQLTEAATRLQKGGLNAIGKQQVTNLAEAKLAETIFKTGPKDDLLAVDVFGISDTGVLSNLTDKMSGFGLSALDSFRKSAGLNTDLTSILSSALGGGFSVDPRALTDRVMASLGGSGNILRGMTDGLQNNLTQGLGIPPQIYNQVQCAVANVVRNCTSGNISNARGISEMINQITGDSTTVDFFDVGAEANLLSGVFREAIQLNIPDSIEAMVEAANSSVAADYALRGNIEAAVTLSDLNTTTLMIERLGVNRVLADVPDASDRLVRNYRLPAETENSDLDAEYLRLTTVLDQLTPGWGSYDRDGTSVSDLTLFSQASPDMLRLLERVPEHRVSAIVARSYRAVSMVSQAKKMYPLAAIR